jgi:protein subunit release factor A
MDFTPLVEKKADRFRELEAAISSPDFYSNPKKATEMMREHTRVKELLAEWEACRKAQIELKESQELAKSPRRRTRRNGRRGNPPPRAAHRRRRKTNPDLPAPAR